MYMQYQSMKALLHMILYYYLTLPQQAYDDSFSSLKTKFNEVNKYPVSI